MLDKELFVIGDGSSEIEVYDSLKFNICRRLNLKELINQCLYIYDYKTGDQSKEILRVATDGKLIMKWSTGVNHGFGLSVTGEANVVLSVYWERVLKEYSPDGQLLREINLTDMGNPNPRHAIKLANGNFLICCTSSGNVLHTVCKVDADGKLERSFDGNCGSTIAQLTNPVYLSVDGNGFVMVADRNNSRVVLLDSDLQFKREILSRKRHGLQWPKRILLDESTGRLIVPDYELILVFEFQ